MLPVRRLQITVRKWCISSHRCDAAMFFHSTPIFFGRPWKKRNGPIAIHAAQRPPESADIDYQALDLKYPMKELNPTFIVEQHAWAPPPTSAPSLPFAIDRSHIGNALPVYTDYRAGRTKVTTILRKIKGDIDELKGEVEKVVGKEVTVRPGKIVIDGNYHRRLKVWLTGLGF